MADEGKKCRCGQNGCLETLVSRIGIARTGQSGSALRTRPVCWRLLLSPTEGWTSDRLFAAARQGDPHAVEIVQRAGHYLGIALANLVNLLNPQMIVLGGLFAQGKDLILPVTRETLKTSAFAGLGRKSRFADDQFWLASRDRWGSRAGFNQSVLLEPRTNLNGRGSPDRRFLRKSLSKEKK